MRRPAKVAVALAVASLTCLLIARQAPKVEKVTETRP